MKVTKPVAEWMAITHRMGPLTFIEEGAFILAIQDAVLDTLNDAPEDWWHPCEVSFDDDLTDDIGMSRWLEVPEYVGGNHR